MRNGCVTNNAALSRRIKPAGRLWPKFFETQKVNTKENKYSPAITHSLVLNFYGQSHTVHKKYNMDREFQPTGRILNALYMVLI